MGGTPLPPFTDKIFGKNGVTNLGGTLLLNNAKMMRALVTATPPYGSTFPSAPLEVVIVLLCDTDTVLPKY